MSILRQSEQAHYDSWLSDGYGDWLTQQRDWSAQYFAYRVRRTAQRRRLKKKHR